jgi:putative ABC transport system substrate-binding protein
MQFGQLKRREFISLLGGSAAWPLVASAQQGARVRWIGALLLTSDSDLLGRASTAALEQGLAKLGWMVGRNLAIDYRWGVTDLEKGRLAIAQVLRLSPDVLFINGGPGLTAGQQAAGTVPIVFTGVSEPVERGFVASMAHPGGNTTGFANLETSMGGKFIELLKEMAPRAARVTALFNPTSSFAVLFFRSAVAAGQKLGIDVVEAHVRDPRDIDGAMADVAREPAAGLILPPDGFTVSHRRQIIDLAARYGLPVIAADKPFAIEGGLAAYGGDARDTFRRAASYVDRILRGEKAADLPVQAPTKYELVINLKTAKALDLTVPDTLLATADEVIE